MEYRICNTCGEEKLLKEFYATVKYKDRLERVCKKCSHFNKDRVDHLLSIKFKICAGCRVKKPLDDFISNKKNPLGKGIFCLQCSKVKVCSSCKVGKSLEEFRARTETPDGRGYRCNSCSKESVNNKRKERYENNDEYRGRLLKRQNERYHRLRKENPEYAYYLSRKNQLWSQFRMTVEDFNTLLEMQGGICGICGNLERTKKAQYNVLRVDHNHLTNQNRGLLCNNCNSGLGFFKESISALQKATEYLSLGKIILGKGIRLKPNSAMSNSELNLWKRFGLTLEEYDTLVQGRQGKCDICFNVPKKLVLDHDHDEKIKHVRGLLCPLCNQGLGMFDHNSIYISKAVDYLSFFALASIMMAALF